jgi:hypothetical protein
VEDLLGVGRRLRPAGERAADRDRERRRSGDPRASRRLASRRQRRVFEPVVARQEREQREIAVAVERVAAMGVDRAIRVERTRPSSRAAISACARRLIAAFNVDAPS